MGLIQVALGLFLAVDACSPWVFPAPGRTFTLVHGVGLFFGLLMVFSGAVCFFTGTSISRFGPTSDRKE